MLHGHTELLGRIAAFEEEKIARERTAAIDAAATRARFAASQGDHEAAVAACREILELDPQHAEARGLVVRSLAGLGRLDEAEAACAALRRVRPSEAAGWVQRLRVLRSQQAARTPAKPLKPEVTWLGDSDLLPASPAATKQVATVPTLKWSAIAGEFLEEHWQKLILELWRCC